MLKARFLEHRLMPLARFWQKMPLHSRGVCLIMASMMCFSVSDNMVKWLSQSHPSMMVIWMRFAGQFVLTLLIFRSGIFRLLQSGNVRLHCLRSLLMFQITACIYLAFALLPIAEATAIFELAPLLITVLAFLFLKEQVGPRRWIGVAIGCVGALVIVRPGAALFDPASILPLLAALGYASYAVLTRAMAASEGPWVSFVYISLVGMVLSSLIVPFYWSPPQGAEYLVVTLQVLIGAGAHLLLILAYRVAAASHLAPFTYCGLLFTTLLGYVIFNEVPDIFTFLGGIIIVGSGIFVWWREMEAKSQN